MNTDFGSIGLTRYGNHQNIIKDWTLLYLSGHFRTNESITYPNVNNYTWNTIVNNTGQYSAGTKSYALTGSDTGNNTGFKWIVFKFPGNSGIDSISTTVGTVYILNLYSKLNSLGFSSTVLNKIRDSGSSTPTASQMLNKDVMCLVTQKDSGNTQRVGNLLYNFQTDNIWYENASDKSLTFILSNTDSNLGKEYSAYGCMYKHSNTQWGAQLEGNSGNDIYVYLGLKNNISQY